MAEKSMLLKSLLIWAAITPLAIANGALREYVLLPLAGNLAYPVSGVLLAATIYLAAFLFLPRLGTGTAGTYLRMGLLWIACTVVFETLLGLLSGDSWSVILANYNFLEGNLWPFVVLFAGATPYIAARARRII